MSIQKQFLKSRPECKVKFRVSKTDIGDAGAVSLVGSFNDWDASANPMSELKSGDFTTTLYLDLDRTYEFRYVVDRDTWMSDPDADGLSPSPYPQVQNSVVSTHSASA